MRGGPVGPIRLITVMRYDVRLITPLPISIEVSKLPHAPCQMVTSRRLTPSRSRDPEVASGDGKRQLGVRVPPGPQNKYLHENTRNIH